MTFRNWREHDRATVVRCPTCGRRAGQPCTGTLGARNYGYAHVTRRELHRLLYGAGRAA